MKDSFILYLEQREVFDNLTDEQAGKIIKTIFEYEATKQVPELEQLLKIIFIPIKQTLDRNSVKYEKTCERNKENIKKRWDKKDTKNTSGKNGKKENTKNTDNEHDNDNDNVFFINKKLNSVFIDWLEYKKQRKEKYTDIGLKKLITEINNKLTKHAEDEIINLINECMSSNYKGIIFDKLKTSNNTQNKGTNRVHRDNDTDYEQYYDNI